MSRETRSFATTPGNALVISFSEITPGSMAGLTGRSPRACVWRAVRAGPVRIPVGPVPSVRRRPDRVGGGGCYFFAAMIALTSPELAAPFGVIVPASMASVAVFTADLIASVMLSVSCRYRPRLPTVRS